MSEKFSIRLVLLPHAFYCFDELDSVGAARGGNSGDGGGAGDRVMN